ncbi:hypothetical protein BDV93DRAFT_230966 [Ceratobasidium sp. AG-I]|nr:hypothetical protein BDV93DRAFT_230966 [Ceratobasidium sp. AG-I]
MFVLQDCSICFEDYDSQRNPYTISCGHVFCRPCLDSLVSSSSTCPHCRMAFGRKTIRKVICTLQDPAGLSRSATSEAETTMWEALSGSIESLDEYEQRRLLVQNNSRSSLQEADFSGNLLVALDVMRFLVGLESTNLEMGHSMDAARAIEESLRDRIAFLEAQLSGTKATFRWLAL